MKKEMDKLKSKIKTNKKFTIFLGVLVIIAVVCGAFFMTILSSHDKTIVKEYLEEYIKNIKTGQFQYLSLFLNTFLNLLISGVVIWLLGISVAGIPIILFLFFCKSFTLGFSIGSMFFVYGWKGSIYSFFYLFPHQILNLFGFGVLVMYALFISIKMIEAVIRKKTIDFKAIMGKYSLVLGVVMLLFLVSALSETFFMPNMMKWMLSIIH